MLKYIQIAIGVILTSFYIFPVEFFVLNGANTKLVMAVVGGVLLLVDTARGRTQLVRNSFLILTAIASIVSLIGYTSVTINETPDYAYASYIVSMWVWLCAAYLLYRVLTYIHLEVNISHVCYYVIGVCVLQCVLAMLIDLYQPIQEFADGLMDNSFMIERKRLYGIGATLDTAGGRFSIAIFMIIYMVLYRISLSDLGSKPLLLGLVFAYVVLVVIGNMIARTTIIGIVVSLVYFLLVRKWAPPMKTQIVKKFVGLLVALCLLVVPLLVYCYNQDDKFQRQIRFGFEGFFSLVEHRQWQVGSNEQLRNMIVFPDNVKTWVIGDGYFNNPDVVDPLYIGEDIGGFYKGTDIGYLRFIFFFGVLGCGAFMFFMYRACILCSFRIPKDALLFVGILIINYIIWFKVATDMFFIFALFLWVDDNIHSNDTAPLKTVQ